MSTKQTGLELENWARSDRYHNSFLLRRDETLERASANSHAHNLPVIAVSAAQGKFLNLIAQSINAKRIVEVGTLGGYSTICLARALPDDGELVTLELQEKHAEVARENIANAGLFSKVKVIVGPAYDSLKKLPSSPQFDLAFIDADNEGNLNYFTDEKRLVRPGGVLIVDNMVHDGEVADPECTESYCEAVRKLLKALKDDTEVEATTIATVGEKGYDGFCTQFASEALATG